MTFSSVTDVLAIGATVGLVLVFAAVGRILNRLTTGEFEARPRHEERR